MIEHFDFDPEKLAQVFAHDADLRTKIHEELYPPPDQDTSSRRTGTSLDAVVDLIHAAQAAGKPVPAVITLNYDDLLETKLREKGVPCTSVFKPYSKEEGVPIYHVHGFLPRDGDIPEQDLVFTESQYHDISSSGFKWSVQTIMHHLYSHHVLFVGISMKDPNLRRFLDAANPDADDPRHYTIRRDFSVAEDEMDSAMSKIRLRAQKIAEKLGREETKGPEELRAALKDVCKKAHDYEKKALRSLGVRPIWVEDDADFSKVVQVIHTRVPNA
jgi:hypothetical protein